MRLVSAVGSRVAFAPPTDLADWARSSALQIVLLVTGAVLLARAASFLGIRVIGRIDATDRRSDALVRSEESKHRHALAQVVTWVAIVTVYLVAGLLVVEKLGVPLTGLVAPAAVAGVALGFGGQRLVQDLLAGFFIFAERQYGFGDVISIAVPGGIELVQGTVEEVTLRITRLRTMNGSVVITPNGQIVQITNLSRDWARAVVDVPVPVGADIAHVNDLLRRVGDQAYHDPGLHDLMLDAPSVMGVEALEPDQLAVRMVARTLPGQQFEIGRALRERVAEAFLREGLSVRTGLDTAAPAGTA